MSDSKLTPPIYSAIPEWAATEIRDTWNAARKAGGELQAIGILERMVDRLGYGRTENNPPLVPNKGLSNNKEGELYAKTKS